MSNNLMMLANKEESLRPIHAENARAMLAKHVVETANSAYTVDGIFASLFGLAKVAYVATLREKFPVIAFRHDGSSVGIFLADTFASARARACKASKENQFITAVVMNPLNTGYTFAELNAGNFSKHVAYIPAAIAGDRKISNTVNAHKKVKGS